MRYFILSGKFLYWYEKTDSQNCLGNMMIDEARIETNAEKRKHFTIKSKTRELRLQVGLKTPENEIDQIIQSWSAAIFKANQIPIPPHLIHPAPQVQQTTETNTTSATTSTETKQNEQTKSLAVESTIETKKSEQNLDSSEKEKTEQKPITEQKPTTEQPPQTT